MMILLLKPKLSFVACPYPHAQNALAELQKIYGHYDMQDADVIVALGGDGFMLHSIHQAHTFNKPVYGINMGRVGFLMNPYNPHNLLQCIQTSQSLQIYPLIMTVETNDGQTVMHYGFNEISLLRQGHQAAHLKITVDDICRLEELVGDGVVVATPIGSTAYNLSAGGPILPLTSNLFALTPLNPFRPRRWSGAILQNKVSIVIENLDPHERQISATADYHEVRNIKKVSIKQDTQNPFNLLFDVNQTLNERNISEQFMV